MKSEAICHLHLVRFSLMALVFLEDQLVHRLQGVQEVPLAPVVQRVPKMQEILHCSVLVGPGNGFRVFL